MGQMYDLVVKAGTIVTSQGKVRADIASEAGKIAVIGPNLSGKTEIDAANKLIFPGVIDAHTHMALPVAETRSSDDFFTGTKAAACGGVTTIIDFTVGAHESSIPVDIEKRIKEASPAVIDYALHGEVIGWRPGRERDFHDAIALGVKSFKFYTAYGDSGRHSDNGVLYHAFRELAALDGVAMIHCEDDAIIGSIISQMGDDKKAEMRSLAVARPAVCEGLAIAQVGYIAGRTGARTHIVHVSSRLGLDEVRRLKAQGIKLTAETCPQYLLLTEDVYARDDGHLFSASPALRTPKDRQALWGGLRSGSLDLVATDHCPFTNEQKTWKGSFLDLPYGLPGVETLLPLLYSEGIKKGRIRLNDIPKLLSETPARIYGLYPRKGTLEVGADADMVIFDPQKEWTISANELHMATDFSPYKGWKVNGKVAATISRGKVVYADGEFRGEKGWGRFVPAA